MPRRKYEKEIDNTATVTTPENVRFDYKLAGPARRFPAFLIDFGIRIASVFLLFMILTCSGLWTLPALGFAFGAAIMLLAYFVVSWFYGIVFEYLRKGRTPGKSALGIQVVMSDGRPVTLVAAVVRNLLRTADIMPLLMFTGLDTDNQMLFVPLFLPAVVCMFLTKQFQRLGDIAANTMVVIVEPEYANRFTDVKDEKMQRISAMLPADLVLEPSTVQALSLYIDRRLRLNSAQREELCGLLTDAIRTKYDLPQELSNDAIACALHYREFYIREDKLDWDEPNEKDTLGLEVNEVVKQQVLPNLASQFPSPAVSGIGPHETAINSNEGNG